MSTRSPQLDLDWEVGLFRLLHRAWRALFPLPTPTFRPEAAHLQEHERHLSILASLLAGTPVRLLPAAQHGGLRGDDLLIPAHLDLGADAALNLDALRLRVAVSATIRRLELDDATSALSAARRASEQLAAELPAFRALHDRVAAAELTSRAEPLDEAERRVRALLDLASPAPEPPATWIPLRMWPLLVPVDHDGEAHGPAGPPPTTGATERKARPVDAIKRVLVDEEKAKEKVIVHSFEKVETLDEHKGHQQRMDGSDELDEHLDALDELDVRELLRGGEQAQSLYRAETGIDTDIPDVSAIHPSEQGILYDEWDQRATRYRPGWCTVYPTPVRGGDPAWTTAALGRHRRLIDLLERRLQLHRTRRERQPRERDGDQIDLDAVIDDLASRRAGRPPLERLYVRRQPRRRSFATTVLLDTSLSTDAWVDDRRVLDVVRDSVLVLGEVTHRLGDALQVLAFASHTRNRCRVWTLRDWQEPWSEARHRLGLLRPQGYTRIGAALRHATASLLRADADRRALLLLSDGKPTDHDRYEGRHGIADVRQAVREAEQRGVIVHALAADPSQRDTLPAMLGPGAWHVLPTPDQLPDALTSLYGRLTGGR